MGEDLLRHKKAVNKAYTLQKKKKIAFRWKIIEHYNCLIDQIRKCAFEGPRQLLQH